MEHAGRQLRDSAEAAIREAGLADHVQLTGRASCLTFVTRDADKGPSQSYRTLFLQELLRRGVLGQSFVTSAAHNDLDIEETDAAIRVALPLHLQTIDRGSVEGLLDGRPVAPAIRQFADPGGIDSPMGAVRRRCGAY